MPTIPKDLLELVLRLKSKWFEFDQGLMMFIWGLILAFPYGFFQTYPEVYKGLASYGSDHTWGIVASLIGVFRMFIVVTQTRTDLGPLFGAWFWASVAIAMAASMTRTGPPTYTCLALISLHTFIFLRVGHSTRRAGDPERRRKSTGVRNGILFY